MKYGASSSLLILDYVPKYQKFQVIRRVEVPRAEYSFDKAVNMIIELNQIYNPTWIYADRGSGEKTLFLELRRLRMKSVKHPKSIIAEYSGKGVSAPDPRLKALLDEAA